VQPFCGGSRWRAAFHRRHEQARQRRLSRRPNDFPKISRTAGWRTTTTPQRCSVTTTLHVRKPTDSSRATRAISRTRCPSTRSTCRSSRWPSQTRKIVRVVRHPLDVCVSMLSTNMTHGFHCGYRIEDISNHLAAVFGPGGTLSPGTRAERVRPALRDPHAQTSRARRASFLDYVGLPSKRPACSFTRTAAMRLHPATRRSPRSSTTGPLADNRHYAQQLKPHVPRLEKMMAAYGYEY